MPKSLSVQDLLENAYRSTRDAAECLDEACELAFASAIVEELSDVRFILNQARTRIAGLRRRTDVK